jgi:hypothetical protein
MSIAGNHYLRADAVDVARVGVYLNGRIRYTVKFHPRAHGGFATMPAPGTAPPTAVEWYVSNTTVGAPDDGWRIPRVAAGQCHYSLIVTS